MNCVQCGEELPASAKFCKKCGCKVQAGELPKAVARGLPPAPTPAFSTCPDCGALCKADVRLCNKCGCRFEDSPSFEDTRRDWDTPLTPDEEKAILVFGNVQDSTSPSPSPQGGRIDTSPAMVIGGGTAAGAAPAVAAPSLRPAEAPADQPRTTSTASGKPRSAPVVAPSASVSAGGAATRPKGSTSSAALRKPRPDAVPAAASGNGKWTALAVLLLLIVVGGGAWWWSQQAKPRSALPAPAVAKPAPVPAVTPEPAPAAGLPVDLTLTPNEVIDPVATTEPPAVDAAPAVTPAAPQEPPAARPAPRKPVRKQTLDDLLS